MGTIRRKEQNIWFFKYRFIRSCNSIFRTSVTLSDKYGQIVGLNENYDLKKGHITLTGSKQDYDLQDVWANVSESGKRIEVHRVFNHMAGVSRFYDPYAVHLTNDNFLTFWFW